MKNIETILGTVTITDARITRKSGYGQYSINVSINFEGTEEEFNIHSTDSQLFDAANGEDNHSEIVLEQASDTIKRAIENYINSL